MLSSLRKRNATLLWVGGGLVVYLGAAWGAYQYVRRPNNNNKEEEEEEEESRTAAALCVWEGLADRYDGLVGRDERVTGVLKQREALLAAHARGSVLEVACGTGRNLLLYPIPSRVWHVTATDSSPAMLAVARNKLIEHGINEQKQRISFQQADAHDLSVFPNSHFDTVVDTFGLCSFSDPVKVLKEMQRVCKKDGNARILLLEHGRPQRYKWLANYIDRRAPRHAEKWGCWWNRDINQIVEEAGLVVHEKANYHLGTGYVIVASPPPAQYSEK